MRALCGAIITAGALLALGLTSIGIGTRYSATSPFMEKTGEKAAEGGSAGPRDPNLPVLVRMSQLDTPLLFSLVFTTSVAIIGLGITVLGLAYHHARREREHALAREQAAARHRTTV